MHTYIIEGGVPLSGTVRVSGSKNAALPVIFATLVTYGINTVYGLPDIEDVRVALELVRGFGAVITRSENCTVIDTRNLSYTEPRHELVCRLRASTYLIGACLGRFGRALTGGFGGCSFSDRPIDLHVYAMHTLGAVDSGEHLLADALSAAEISFPIVSVGATVNALIATATAEGESIIRGASREPHIDTLIEFLRGAGAKITVRGNTIYVVGTRLTGSSVTIPGDMIEAGTFLAISALSGGKVGVMGADIFELNSFLCPLVNSGIRQDRIDGAYYLSGKADKPIEIVTAPYPGFPTDLQPILAPLLSLSEGGTIKETVWQGRFGYLLELSKMGLSYKLSDSTAQIYKSIITPATAVARDLRGGAALVIAALFAQGQSIIEGADILDRGYERFEEKLKSIGAKIKILKST